MANADRRAVVRWIWRLFGAFIALNLMNLPMSDFQAITMAIVCGGMLMLAIDKELGK